MDKKAIKTIFLTILLVGVFVGIVTTLPFWVIGLNKNFKNIEYGEHSKNKFDIHLPENKNTLNNEVPAFVFIHGGAWRWGDKKDTGMYQKDIIKAGYAYVSINYRMVGDNAGYKEMIDDIHNALVKLKEIAPSYKIRTDKIGLGGISAGGHLALLYALTKESPIDIAFIVSHVGPTDLSYPEYFNDGGGISTSDKFDIMNKLIYADGKITPDFILTQEYKDMENVISSSPINFAHPEMPPVIMAYGKFDGLVPFRDPEAFSAKLTENGVRHEYIVFQNSGHGLENPKSDDKAVQDAYIASVEAYGKAMTDFFTQYLPL